MNQVNGDEANQCHFVIEICASAKAVFKIKARGSDCSQFHGIGIPGLDGVISLKQLTNSVLCPQTLFPSPTYTCYIIHNLYSFTVSTVLTICIYLFGLGPHPWKHSTSSGSRKTWRAVWDIRPVTGRGASMAARSWHAITSESRESNE